MVVAASSKNVATLTLIATVKKGETEKQVSVLKEAAISKLVVVEASYWGRSSLKPTTKKKPLREDLHWA